MKFSEYDATKVKSGDKKGEKPTLDPKTAKLLKTLVGKYEGKSRDEIFAAVMNVAGKSRKEGKLSDAEIDGFYQLIAPMLDDEKLKTLNEVVAKIKEQ